MAKLWHHLRGRGHPEEQRFGLNDLTTLYNRDELLHLGKRYGSADNETIDNDFVGYINGAYKANGAVFAVSLARMLVFTEVRFAYQRFTEDGRPGDLYRLPSLKILEKPWPNGTTGDLLARAIQDTDLCGNHYVVREGSGPDSRLRRLRPDWVSIILTSPPDKAVASDVVGYLYKPGGTEDKSLWKLYPVDGSNGAIAHWTPIPDPEAMYRGMSWLTPVLREVMHDNAATKHKLKFFENAATPNLAVSFKETVTAEQFREFMGQLDDNHAAGDNAYKTLYLGGGADVRVIGSKMEEINFKSTQGLSESRIAAAGRVHPALVGLSEGLQGSFAQRGQLQGGPEQLRRRDDAAALALAVRGVLGTRRGVRQLAALVRRARRRVPPAGPEGAGEITAQNAARSPARHAGLHPRVCHRGDHQGRPPTAQAHRPLLVQLQPPEPSARRCYGPDSSRTEGRRRQVEAEDPRAGKGKTDPKADARRPPDGAKKTAPQPNKGKE
ncbi:phage portal protein [Rhodococcus hoagii]|nr:phage portal protein [Prescottella equi]